MEYKILIGDDAFADNRTARNVLFNLIAGLWDLFDKKGKLEPEETEQGFRSLSKFAAHHKTS